MVKNIAISFYKDCNAKYLEKSVLINNKNKLSEDDINNMSAEEVIKATGQEKLFETYPYIAWGYTA